MAAEPAAGRRASCVAWLGRPLAPSRERQSVPRAWGALPTLQRKEGGCGKGRAVNFSCSSQCRRFGPWLRLWAGELPGPTGW